MDKPMDLGTITIDQLTDSILEDQFIGFCIACRQMVDGCEPDARGYRCEACGEPCVYGAEEILIMGLAVLVLDPQ
jgi:hypothetical protein